MLRKISLFLLLLILWRSSSGFNHICHYNDSVPPLIYEMPLADTTIIMHWHNADKTKVMFVIIHDDENTSSRLGYGTMEHYEASVLELKNDNKYLFTIQTDTAEYTFNPNRIFTIGGIESSLSTFGPCNDNVVEEIRQFSTTLAGAFFNSQNFIISLHNNANKGFGIESYKTDTTLAAQIDSVHINPNLDPDDFFYVVNPEHFMMLKNSDFNVVLQTRNTGFDDGSLSWWCMRHNIPYINIEAEHFHFNEQLFMLDYVMKMIVNK